MKHAVRSAILGLAAVCALAISGCGDSSRTAAPQNAQAQGNLMQKIKEKGQDCCRNFLPVTLPMFL